MPRVRVRFPKRLGRRKPRDAPPPDEVREAWDAGNVDPLCSALWHAGPMYLEQHRDQLRDPLTRLHDSWLGALEGDKAEGERLRKVAKALSDIGRGRFPDLEQTDKEKRERKNLASYRAKAVARLVENMTK